jgi:hypothetical protein
MTELLPTAAYIVTKNAKRTDTANHIASLLRGKTIQVAAFRIWELLNSAQTLDSVTRALVDQFKFDRPACHRELDDLFKKLLQMDIVELSPDT